MTMLSFRVGAEEAGAAQDWADRLGIDRSELLREALRLHLVRLKSELDAEAWELNPRTEAEAALDAVAEWGPAEDWSDWSNAAG